VNRGDVRVGMIVEIVRLAPIGWGDCPLARVVDVPQDGSVTIRGLVDDRDRHYYFASELEEASAIDQLAEIVRDL